MSQQNHNPNGSEGPEVDPLLDAMLSEVLGGATPPDLTARIMQRQAELQQARAKQARADSMLPPSYASITAAAREEAGIQSSPSENAPRPVAIHPRSTSAQSTGRASTVLGNGRERRRRRRHRQQSLMVFATIAMSAAIVAASVGVIAYNQSLHDQGNPAVVEHDRPDRPAPEVRSPREPRTEQPSPEEVVEHQGQPEDANPAQSPPPSHSPQEGPQNGSDLAANRLGGPPPFSEVDQPHRTAEQPSERPYIEPLYDLQVVALVDQNLAQAWADAGIDPSAATADSEWARRVYLRVLGRIPTVAELTHYMRQDSPEKQAELLDLLLTGEKYADEFAENWAEFWTNTLIGRRGGMQADSLASRDGLTDYLRQSIRANKPFDQITYELLTAEGTNLPDSQDYNGAVNFLLASYDDQAKLATNRTTQVFLGKQLQCAQCHNHHVNAWPQQQYWQINSFFRQMHAEQLPGSEVVRLVDRDFAGDSGSYDEAEVFYEQVNGLGKVAYPVWLDGEAINPDGRVSEVRRRVELARRVVSSDDFARATTNRLWDHFLGRGLTKPVDDMGPHNPPSHPEVLSKLSEQFAAHDYDFKSLIRWIALSEPFNLSSRPSATNLADSGNVAERPLFSRYYTRQMEAEELYDSLVMLADSRTGSQGSTTSGDVLAKRAFVGQFARDMNTDEGNEIINFDGSMQQSLSMMNGDLMDRATNVDSGNILRRVLRSGDMSWADKIEHLFLASLSRPPHARELKVADRLLASHRGNQAAALEDLWWALLNSNEFILDH